MIKHHSYKIQNVIQKELFAAKHSIKICVAWFTNDLLFQPLLLKLDAGVEVTIITNKDEINFAETNDVDFDEFIQRGGCIYWNERGDKSRLLHHKFCIIDDSVVISGSYNWTNGAEYNDEDITVYSEELETTKHYSDIFDKLAAQLPKSKGEVKRTTHQEEQTVDLTQQLQARYCEIGEYIDGLAKVCRTIGNNRLWGFVNEQGEEVIPCRYNSVEEFHGGLSFVCLGHYFGAIDKNGTEIIPFQHKSIHWRDNNFIEAYLGNDELCVYDNSGVRIDSNRIIVYTTLDGDIADPSLYSVKIVSHTYKYGIGIVVFDNAIRQIRWVDECETYCVEYEESVSKEELINVISFCGCRNLTSIFIPDSVTKIGEYAFSSCINLTSVTIPDNVTTIGERAFSGCKSLTSVTISNGVTEIGKFAFDDCKSLTSVTIPDSVTTIGEGVFSGCSSLQEINSRFASEDKRCLIVDGRIILFISIGITSYIIPNSVTTIGADVFKDCINLTSVTIPDSVITIGERAFSGCKSLTSVTIPDSVTRIENGAFRECRRLTSVTIPDSVTTIGYGAFRECRRLTSVTIPDSVTTIGGEAFRECYSLTSVTIGNGVTAIGVCAFSWCDSLTSVTIPDSVTTIGDGAFRECRRLTSVTIPDSVTTIGNRAFWECHSLTSVTIPDSVTTIGYSAFEGCTSLISVTIPDSVTTIGYSAFEGCTSLISVTIPDSVTTIGYSAFEGCTSLISVTIPDSVTTIGDGAFSGCSGLQVINSRFASNDKRCLIVNGNLLSVAPFGLFEYDVPNGVTTIGKRAFARCANLTNINIPNGVANICEFAFYDCTCLSNINIPESVMYIGEGAFARCANLTNIDIPKSVLEIGYFEKVFELNERHKFGAFEDCTNIISINIPEGVISIGENIFKNCRKLKDIYFKSITPPNARGLMFGYYVSSSKIYVPTESVEAYKKAPEWEKYADQIIGYDFENEKEI